jgi:hypothetical protein
MQKNAPLAYASMRRKFRRTKTRRKRHHVQQTCARATKTAPPENTAKSQGPALEPLMRPARAVPNGLLNLLAVWLGNSNYNANSPEKTCTKHGFVKTFGGDTPGIKSCLNFLAFRAQKGPPNARTSPQNRTQNFPVQAPYTAQLSKSNYTWAPNGRRVKGSLCRRLV